MKSWVGAGLWLLVLLAAAGCLTYTQSSGDESSRDVGTYRLKPLDPINVVLRGIPEGERVIEETIDESGRINLMYLDSIEAAGKSTAELEDEIERAYIDNDIYRDVTVHVMMYAKSYYVRGEVKSPGQYQITKGTTLLQAIAAAGGYTEYANERKIQITRGGETYFYNAKKLEKNPGRDPMIEAGDVIRVWRSIF
ncbi:polysaccharide biosynthesis/export family protein [Kiritimatiella glycovorans]|uniref:Polysaccharide export protein Wza n=1 Tax=Kiritimatiella glycovorans TaxID=1307763 RepID=A0A0G3EIA7_9BACT|nr:polysaccharide biosynthesis/export family protein [Kiritimatiella glycovorans]AKJ65172.1 polysaccharide export protein Wza [Kiritimatiella glycovorans]